MKISNFELIILEKLESGCVVGGDITSRLYIAALKSEAAEHYGVVIDGIPDIDNEELNALIKSKVRVRK